MRICFHKDPVSVEDLCADLNEHGAIYWHTSRQNFRSIGDLIEEHGIEIVSSCAKFDGNFFNFIVRSDLADEGLALLSQHIAQAIYRWQTSGEPVPHNEPI